MVIVLKFWTPYSILFFLPKFCFLCSCFIKYLVGWQTDLLYLVSPVLFCYQDVEKELELQISMKQEIEMALRLLEKDIHEKQDSLIAVRGQLEEVKTINLQMYSKLEVRHLVRIVDVTVCTLNTPQPLYNITCIAWIQGKHHVKQQCVSKQKCIDYIRKMTINGHFSI